MRYRSAENRSIVWRAFRIRVASQGSCWFANPMFARAREIRPKLVHVNSNSAPKLQQLVRLSDASDDGAATARLWRKHFGERRCPPGVSTTERLQNSKGLRTERLGA